MSTLRVDQITDEEGTGAPDFPNGIEVAGGALAGLADQAEAEAGTDNTKLMTPLRTAQAIAELSPAPSELTQTQVEDSTSTVFGTVSGQRLEQQTNAAFNVTGAAPKFACRAWVNFNGSNGSIRASGNVSSVSRLSTGNYQVNFSTAMPTTDYVVVATNSHNWVNINSSLRSMVERDGSGDRTTNLIRLQSLTVNSGAASNVTDQSIYNNVVIFC